MNEDKRKHLEFIQNVVARMSTNSFALKGWMITLVSALFALAAKDADPRYVIITYIAIPVFWLLDAFYLAQERRYRDLYNQVRTKSDNEIDFDLDATPFSGGDNGWWATAISRTLIGLYLPMIAIAAIAMLWLCLTKK